MQVEAQVHCGGGLASAVLGPVDAVGDQFHHSGSDGVNPDLETVQEALAFFARSKARLDVLKVCENRPEKRFEEVSRTHLVCVRQACCDRGLRYHRSIFQRNCGGGWSLAHGGYRGT